MPRPAGRPPGEAAERDEIKHTRRTESAPASQALRLIRTPELLFQAYADYRAAIEAERAGLIGRGTALKLALRAQERIRAAQTGLPLPRARDRDPEPLEFCRLQRRGEMVPAADFLQWR